MEFQKASAFLRNAYYQGHGRYVNQIARLTIKFCKNSGGSREVRKFIETRLVDTAKENPGCVIYVKPRLFKSPVVTAEYLNGNEQYLSLYKMSSAQVEAWIKWLITRSGAHMMRIEKPVTTLRPSIQGIWTPFTYRDPKLNLTEFPSDTLGCHVNRQPTATEQLIQIQQNAASNK